MNDNSRDIDKPQKKQICDSSPVHSKNYSNEKDMSEIQPIQKEIVFEPVFEISETKYCNETDEFPAEYLDSEDDPSEHSITEFDPVQALTPVDDHNETQNDQIGDLISIEPVNNSFTIDSDIEILYDTNFDLQSMMYDQLSAQILRMKMLYERISDTDKEVQLNVEFNIENESRYAEVLEIPSDGNCMFTAISYQLNAPNYNKSELKVFSKQLRPDILTFILDENYQYFYLAVESRLVEELKRPIKEDEDPKKIFRSKYKNDGYWGGFETLSAVSMMFDVNIMIINEKGDYYYATNFNKNYEKTIILAYRLRKVPATILNQPRIHYDSVIHIDQNDLFFMTKTIARKMESTNEIL